MEYPGTDGISHGREVFTGTYTGTVQAGKPHGAGSYHFTSTVTSVPGGEAIHKEAGTYVGDWREGHMHGRGKADSARIYHRGGGDSYVYDGDFQFSMWHGHGRYTRIGTEGEMTIEGDFQKGCWHGKVTLTSPDGCKKHGDFRFSSPHGYCEITYCDGTQTAGQFYEGKLHGPCKLTLMPMGLL